MRTTIGTLATLATLALGAGSAEGAAVLRSCDVFSCEPTLTFSAAPGEANHVRSAITNGQGRRLWLVDLNNPIALAEADGPFRGNGCVHPPRTDREWPFPGAPERHVVACRWGDDGEAQVSLGDGNDVASVTIQGGRLLGGPGDDALALTGSDGTLSGGSGADQLTGDDGADRLDGGPGDDQLDGRLGPDVLRGGDGRDVVRWHRAQGEPGHGGLLVTVGAGADDGNVGDDGAPDGPEHDGRRDDVGADVEVVEGGAAPDLLVGTGGPQELRGGGGADLLSGLDGDDDLVGGEGRDRLAGGPGRDVLRGDGQDDELDGGADDDALDGGPQRDLLHGGDGDDLLDGGPGSATLDDLSGGEGTDLVSYATRQAPVRVSLDDVADDGQAGERDDVRSDVEHVLGGAGRDELVGSAAANLLLGGPGDDLLRGLGGPDELRGGPGTDTVTYDERKAGVRVTVDAVADDGAPKEGDLVATDVETLVGTAAADVLSAGKGPHSLFGGAGDDELRARDSSRDLVDGGDGRDAAELDPIDTARSVELRR